MTEEEKQLILTLTKDIKDDTINWGNRVAESTRSIWNAILTINGIFLSLFKTFSDKINLTGWETVVFVTITALPIVFVLWFTICRKMSTTEGFDNIILLGKTVLKNIKDQTAPSQDSPQKNNRKTKIRKLIYKINPKLELISIAFTFLSVFYMCWIIIESC
jgi:hypothetical protein